MKKKKEPRWILALREMAFESRTTAGKTFDIFMLVIILGSIVIVMLDSIQAIHEKHAQVFHEIEWGLTIIFTIEYLIRLVSAPSRKKFIFSFLGIIDLIAIIPTYITLFVSGPETLLMLRVLRLLRIFRIFRLSHFLADINFLAVALYKSLRKISIFMIFAMVLVVLLGSLMYIVEKDTVFTSIPESIYWALVTITTVGYGDLVPHTAGGKAVAGLVMLIGYAIIAVPMGIITSEMAHAFKEREEAHSKICKTCNKPGHDHDAAYCKFCGGKFDLV